MMLYCVFPGAMTFGILYSEPLAVALGAAALLALVAAHGWGQAPIAPVSMAIFAGVQGPLVMTTAWPRPSAASVEH
jgi:hypothetical protein